MISMVCDAAKMAGRPFDNLLQTNEDVTVVTEALDELEVDFSLNWASNHDVQFDYFVPRAQVAIDLYFDSEKTDWTSKMGISVNSFSSTDSFKEFIANSILVNELHVGVGSKLPTEP